MKISVEWLKEYIDLPESLARLKEDLTMGGLVVEAISGENGSAVLEVEITSNRPDCLSHCGVAREISALYQRTMRWPRRTRRLALDQERIPFSVEIDDPDLCPRYVGLVMDEIRVGTSPDWLRRRLEAAGMRPVNNIVDITNYVLLELGHPLHAFDFRSIRGGRIVVGRARPGQRFTTLDGVERELDGEMLMINDGEGPVAVAGVMGGMNSEISLDTNTVLLECAYFKPSSVRKTSKKLGLSTEASYRFERGMDWNAPGPSIARTAFLIRKLAGGRIAGSIRDVYPKAIAPVEIELRRQNAEALLGVGLEDSFVVAALRSLNFRTVRIGRGKWRVTCPTYRADAELEADLVEEIGRLYGYQKIPTKAAPTLTSGLPSPVSFHENSARRTLLGLGYSEAVSLSFADAEEVGLYRLADSAPVRIRNPLTSDTELLRTSLVPGLVRAARRNFNFNRHVVRLFELGKAYWNGADGPSERRMLCILGTGSFTGNNWRQPGEEYDFFHLKGVVDALLRSMRCPDAAFRPAETAPFLNPADAAIVSLAGASVGCLGSLLPSIAEALKLRQPVFVAELDFAELTRRAFLPVKFEPLAKYPSVERDLSAVVSRNVRYDDVRDAIRDLGIAELVTVELMDVYEGPQVSAGKLSMLLRFIFQDREATLTVDRVQGFSDNIRALLRDKFGAEFR